MLYAFDPRRCAILLARRQDKTGDPIAGTTSIVPLADRLYDEHLALLKKEGLTVMAKKFSRSGGADVAGDRRARVRRAATRQLLAEMPLQELRRALDLTQQQVAAALGINQVAVSKMESQTDMYVSTLRRFVEAMGGELRIVARFPQGNVEISQFKREAGTDRTGGGVEPGLLASRPRLLGWGVATFPAMTTTATPPGRR